MTTARIVSRPTPNALVVELNDSDSALANQLRWALERDVPNEAISSVRVLQNTSPFPDEYIAHRVAMIPFRRKDAGHAEQRIRISKTAGASRAERVLAGEASGGYEAVWPRLAIATLPPECTLTIEATFTSGTGREHQRFSHVAAAGLVQRTKGTSRDRFECWCEETPYGVHCVECMGSKRPASLCDAPTVHDVHFETDGPRTADDTLRAALAVTRAKLRFIAEELECQSQNAFSLKDKNAPSEPMEVTDSLITP